MRCPITLATQDIKLKIVDIVGGKIARHKLFEKGLYIGECVCVSRKKCGDIILKTKTSKYAMGFGLANKIMVDEI